jgi:hypothetical protein
MQDLIVLALVIAVWWFPALQVIRQMDLLPGLPRPLFWSVLPLIGLPVVGPLLYVLWLRRRLTAIGTATLARKATLDRDRRSRGAGRDFGSR